MNVHLIPPYGRMRVITLSILTGGSVMGSMPVFAELSPALDRVSISAGVLRTDPTINVSLNSAYGNLGTGDVGLGKETIPRIKADLMIFDSQGLSFDAYQYKQGYTGSFNKSTQINGTALTTVGNANLNLKLDFAKLSYKWWIGSGATVVGLGAGAAYYKVGMNANATVSINTTTSSASGSYTDDAVAPLLEVSVRHAITPDLRLLVNLAGMKKSNGQMNGEINNAAVGVEWFPIKNVGAVVEYGVSQINLNNLNTLDTNLKLKIQGPSAFIKARF
jgi:hypothetical protein